MLELRKNIKVPKEISLFEILASQIFYVLSKLIYEQNQQMVITFHQSFNQLKRNIPIGTKTQLKDRVFVNINKNPTQERPPCDKREYRRNNRKYEYEPRTSKAEGIQFTILQRPQFTQHLLL